MIEIVHTRQNEDDQTVFFKIDIDGEIYEWHGDVPLGADPQAYFEAMQDKIHFLILGKMYPESDWQRFRTEENTDLEAFLEWISKGHKNKVIVGYDEKEKPVYGYQVIDKVPWRSTHPKEIALAKEIDSATTVAQLKTVVKKILV